MSIPSKETLNTSTSSKNTQHNGPSPKIENLKAIVLETLIWKARYSYESSLVSISPNQAQQPQTVPSRPYWVALAPLLQAVMAHMIITTAKPALNHPEPL